MRRSRLNRPGIALFDLLGAVALFSLTIGIVFKSFQSIVGTYRHAAEVNNVIARQSHWLSVLRADAGAATQVDVKADTLALTVDRGSIRWTLTADTLQRSESADGTTSVSNWPVDKLKLRFALVPGDVLCLIADEAPVPLTAHPGSEATR